MEHPEGYCCHCQENQLSGEIAKDVKEFQPEIKK